MNLRSIFERYYLKNRTNRWYWLFSIFCRLSLAYAFIVAGMVKILGERFASGLSELHPMGAYLEALHHTGPYYTFIGVAQVVAAILLLIPRTVVLGALLYFPIILNIWILSYAVRFEGSILTSPLMVLANLFLIIWHYDNVRYLLPFRTFSALHFDPKPKNFSKKFPYLFFSGVLLTVVLTALFARFGFDIVPRNSLSDCKDQIQHVENKAAADDFCDCIHLDGKPLNVCLDEYETSTGPDEYEASTGPD